MATAATAAAKTARSLLAVRLSSSSYFLHSKRLFSSSSSITKSPPLPNLARLRTLSLADSLGAIRLNGSKGSYSPLNSGSNFPAPLLTRRDSPWSSNLQVRFHSSMVGIHNKQTKFPKHRKGRIEGICDGGNDICFGKYGLQALEPARITSRQLEAGRRALQLNARRGGRGGKVWVRAFPYKSVTSKPSETRMGRGKGSIAHWVAVVKPGRVLYEMGGVPESIARRAIQIVGSKLPIRTRSIIRDGNAKETAIR